MTSATTLRCDTAVARFRDLQSGEPQAGAARVWTPAMASFCQARLGHLPPGADASLHGVEPSYAREAHYWRGAAALAARDPKRALAEARAGLSLLGALANDELRWRLAAIGAIAARRLDDAAAAGLEDTARAALDRLQREWGQDAAAYEHRGDLAELGSRAGLF